MNIFLNNFFIKENFIYIKNNFLGFIKIPKILKINIINNILFIDSVYKKNINSFKKKIKNLILGIEKKWETELTISGVGYKIIIKKKYLFFYFGFTTPKIIEIPFYIEINIIKNLVLIKSIYKDKLGIFVKKILNIKKYNPYKKKGIFISTFFFTKKSSKKKT